MKRELKNLALAFSSANLCLLAVWRRLILATSTDKFLARNHTSNDFLSILLNVLLFTSLFWVVLALGQRSKRRYVQTSSRWLPMYSFFFPVYLLSRSDPALHLQNRLLVLVGRNGVIFPFFRSAPLFDRSLHGSLAPIHDEHGRERGGQDSWEISQSRTHGTTCGMARI